MASIRKRGDTFTITAYMGYDEQGKQRKKTTTYRPPDGVTPGKAEKLAQAFAANWEEKIRGYVALDENRTFFKVYRAAVAFQPLKVYLAVYHIAGKTRNAFDQKQVDFMVFCVRHHLLKPRSIYGPCRGVFVRIDFYQFPSRVLSDIIGVVILLDLIALFLLILLCADAAVGSNLLFFVGFFFADFPDNQCLHLPLRSSAGER